MEFGGGGVDDGLSEAVALDRGAVCSGLSIRWRRVIGSSRYRRLNSWCGDCDRALILMICLCSGGHVLCFFALRVTCVKWSVLICSLTQ